MTDNQKQKLSPTLLRALRDLIAAERLGLCLHRHTFDGGGPRWQQHRALRNRALVAPDPMYTDWPDAPWRVTPAGHAAAQRHARGRVLAGHRSGVLAPSAR